MGKDNTIPIAFFEDRNLPGQERDWLLAIASSLGKPFKATYFVCGKAPEQFKDAGFRIVEIEGAEDLQKLLERGRFRLAQSAGGLPKLGSIPLVEYSHQGSFSREADFFIHSSQSRRSRWFLSGGNLSRSAVVYFPQPPWKEKGTRKKRTEAKGAVIGFVRGQGSGISSEDIRNAAQGASIIEFEMNSENRLMGNPCKAEGEGVLPESSFLEKIDFLCISSNFPPHGLITGALSMGKPCIIHSYGQSFPEFRELVGPGGVVTEDSDEFSRTSGELCDGRTRGNFSRKAKAHSAEYYSRESCAGMLSAFYSRILCIRRPQPTPLQYGYSRMGYLYAGDLDRKDAIAYHVIAGSVPEEFEASVVLFFLPKVKTFVDIGANTGLYCFLAAKSRVPAIHAFEPQPDCCIRLEKTVSLNNWEGTVRAHMLGLSDKPGEMTLRLLGTGSYVESRGKTAQGASRSKTVRIAVDSLDNQVKKLGIRDVDFIKIDVEGFEQRVLEGAEKTISFEKPVLFMEIVRQLPGRAENPNYLKTFAWLKSHGYSLFRCTEDFRLENATNPKPEWNLGMYLCLHQDEHADMARGILEWNRRMRFVFLLKEARRLGFGLMRRIRAIAGRRSY